MQGRLLNVDGLPRADDDRHEAVGHVRRGRVVGLGRLEERHSRIHLFGFSGNHFGKRYGCQIFTPLEIQVFPRHV